MTDLIEALRLVAEHADTDGSEPTNRMVVKKWCLREAVRQEAVRKNDIKLGREIQRALGITAGRADNELAEVGATARRIVRAQFAAPEADDGA